MKKYLLISLLFIPLVTFALPTTNLVNVSGKINNVNNTPIVHYDASLLGNFITFMQAVMMGDYETGLNISSGGIGNTLGILTTTGAGSKGLIMQCSDPTGTGEACLDVTGNNFIGIRTSGDNGYALQSTGKTFLESSFNGDVLSGNTQVGTTWQASPESPFNVFISQKSGAGATFKSFAGGVSTSSAAQFLIQDDSPVVTKSTTTIALKDPITGHFLSFLVDTLIAGRTVILDATNGVNYFKTLSVGSTSTPPYTGLLVVGTNTNPGNIYVYGTNSTPGVSNGSSLRLGYGGGTSSQGISVVNNASVGNEVSNFVYGDNGYWQFQSRDPLTLVSRGNPLIVSSLMDDNPQAVFTSSSTDNGQQITLSNTVGKGASFGFNSSSTYFTMGLNGDTRNFEIANSGTLGTNNRLSLTPAGELTLYATTTAPCFTTDGVNCLSSSLWQQVSDYLTPLTSGLGLTMNATTSVDFPDGGFIHLQNTYFPAPINSNLAMIDMMSLGGAFPMGGIYNGMNVIGRDLDPRITLLSADTSKGMTMTYTPSNGFVNFDESNSGDVNKFRFIQGVDVGNNTFINTPTSVIQIGTGNTASGTQQSIIVGKGNYMTSKPGEPANNDSIAMFAVNSTSTCGDNFVYGANVIASGCGVATFGKGTNPNPILASQDNVFSIVNMPVGIGTTTPGLDSRLTIVQDNPAHSALEVWGGGSRFGSSTNYTELTTLDLGDGIPIPTIYFNSTSSAFGEHTGLMSDTLAMFNFFGSDPRFVLASGSYNTVLTISSTTGMVDFSLGTGYEFDNDVTITSQAGSGNAYACLDSTGKLFRSATPCI